MRWQTCLLESFPEKAPGPAVEEGDRPPVPVGRHVGQPRVGSMAGWA